MSCRSSRSEPEALDPPPDLAAQDNALFDEVSTVDFGPFRQFVWNDLGRINVLVGRNDTGKSTLLKLIYAFARSVQDYTRRMDSDRPPWGEVLAEKLMWTFQSARGTFHDLAEGMPPNEIVEEALAMADEDVDLAMAG